MPSDIKPTCAKNQNISQGGNSTFVDQCLLVPPNQSTLTRTPGSHRSLVSDCFGPSEQATSSCLTRAPEDPPSLHWLGRPSQASSFLEDLCRLSARECLTSSCAMSSLGCVMMLQPGVISLPATTSMSHIPFVTRSPAIPQTAYWPERQAWLTKDLLALSLGLTQILSCTKLLFSLLLLPRGTCSGYCLPPCGIGAGALRPAVPLATPQKASLSYQ